MAVMLIRLTKIKFLEKCAQGHKKFAYTKVLVFEEFLSITWRFRAD